MYAKVRDVVSTTYAKAVHGVRHVLVLGLGVRDACSSLEMRHSETEMPPLWDVLTMTQDQMSRLDLTENGGQDRDTGEAKLPEVLQIPPLLLDQGCDRPNGHDDPENFGDSLPVAACATYCCAGHVSALLPRRTASPFGGRSERDHIHLRTPALWERRGATWGKVRSNGCRNLSYGGCMTHGNQTKTRDGELRQALLGNWEPRVVGDVRRRYASCVFAQRRDSALRLAGPWHVTWGDRSGIGATVEREDCGHKRLSHCPRLPSADPPEAL